MRALLLLLASAAAFRAPQLRVPAPRSVRAAPLPHALALKQPQIACSAAREQLPSSRGRKLSQRVSACSAFALGLMVPALALASSATGEHLHLGQKIALYFSGTGLPDWAVLSLISMVPAVELRGSVPVGNWMGLNPWVTLVICVLGNMVPIAPTLLALRSKMIRSVAKPLLERAQKKLAGLPQGQSQALALALFVGIPAPGTGAWTGAIIAYLLDMPFGTAMGAIFLGVVLAGLIMTVLTLAGKTGALIALAALIVAGIGAIGSAMKKEQSGDAN